MGAGREPGLAVVVPPVGPITIHPIDPDVVGFVREFSGARTVQRLRVGPTLLRGGGQMWLDQQGHLRGLQPNPRATGLFLISCARPPRLRKLFVGTVVFTGPADHRTAGPQGLSGADATQLRQTAVTVRFH